MSTHWLKVWSEYYDDVESGRKPFEVRIDDRLPRYEVGDILILASWDKEERKYIGRECEKVVTYVLRDPQFVIPGHCIMGLEPMQAPGTILMCTGCMKPVEDCRCK